MKKIIIFGASEKIHYRTQRLLDWDNVEFVAYIDNNPMLWGETLGGKTIYPPKEMLTNSSFDAVLLGAVYYAPLMRKQIVDINSYYKDKNFLFWDEESLQEESFFDPTLYISADEMKWIYKESEKMEVVFKEVYKQLPETAQVGNYSVFSENNYNPWWKGEGKLIAHAGGGFVNGERLQYTNSKESFYESYANGFKYIEADIMETTDGELVVCAWFRPYYDQEQATYNQFLDSCNKHNYTPMVFVDLISFMNKYLDVHIVIDLKSRTIEHYKSILMKIVSVVKNQNNADDILQRFVIQVHELQTLAIARNIYLFPNITLTLYRMHVDNLQQPSKLAKMCAENNVPIVTMGCENMNYEYLRFFIANNIRICIHTVDSLAQLKKGQYLGVDSFMTNWLLPSKH